MTDIETRLDEALKAGAPPPRDAMFRIEVLVRRERAQFRRWLLSAGAMAFVAGLLGVLVGVGAERLALIATAILALTAGLVAPWVETRPTVRNFVGFWRAGALATLQSIPIPRLWS